MCLILIAHQMTEQRPLLVLANRDEFYNRPTAAAQRWEECPELVAGRDLVSGGSWFGARGSRWASVTNIREGGQNQGHHHKSRGWLVRDYLLNNLSPADFLTTIEATIDDFAAFNLLLGDGSELWHFSNRENTAKALAPGIYGLSNHLLDTPWPKVVRAKKSFKRLIGNPNVNYEDAFSLLADTNRTADSELPETGVPLEWERALSAIFISMPEYGTRCSTFLMTKADGRRQFIERRFDGAPHKWEESRFSWSEEASFLDR